jgi:DNA-directed RNA polymerase subunit L/DNA-directed RNA polymerase alpha subunit
MSTSASNNVRILDVIHEEGAMKFTLANIEVCYANALRRTLLSEVDICVIKTENEEVNQCFIETNTSRLHNEILKQRLSCIPIHIKDLDMLPDKYVLELDASNETENIIYVTTEQFRIRNKTTGNYCTPEETHKIFPPNAITQSYIDFCRLRPKISDTIPGEKIKLTAEFSRGNAKENSMYNVVSTCSYMNTNDPEASAKEWERREKELREKYTTITEEEVRFERRNFELLDAQRFFKSSSFDFVIKSIGIYDNMELMQKVCIVLQNKLIDLIQAIAENTLSIRTSEVTMEHCYDVILENEDYTMGKLLEYHLYKRFYDKEKVLSFCGFKKFHPHNTESIIRIAFTDDVTMDQIKYVLKEVCDESQKQMKEIYHLFESRNG